MLKRDGWNGIEGDVVLLRGEMNRSLKIESRKLDSVSLWVLVMCLPLDSVSLWVLVMCLPLDSVSLWVLVMCLPLDSVSLWVLVMCLPLDSVSLWVLVMCLPLELFRSPHISPYKNLINL
ncbi:unnamed protein product [Vicia faba]|uniref:Uncharacterized protein n=1 Tax=Vicia faba TaxID=3906 RepID=A0AAV0Z1D2_VICFA|nr:unnamed protein product [Vicia faba]